MKYFTILNLFIFSSVIVASPFSIRRATAAEQRAELGKQAFQRWSGINGNVRDNLNEMKIAEKDLEIEELERLASQTEGFQEDCLDQLETVSLNVANLAANATEEIGRLRSFIPNMITSLKKLADPSFKDKEVEMINVYDFYCCDIMPGYDVVFFDLQDKTDTIIFFDFENIVKRPDSCKESRCR